MRRDINTEHLMSLTWNGPLDLCDFTTPSRGAFAALRHKGVYRLHLADPSGHPVSLPRLRAVDPTGTLYVGGVPNGKDSTVFDRLKGLARTVERAHTEEQVPHRGGWNLYVFGLIEAFSIPHGGGQGANRLVVYTTVSPGWSRGDSARIEADLLLRYRGVFGDNPPANLSSGHIGVDTGKVRQMTAKAANEVAPADWFRA